MFKASRHVIQLWLILSDETFKEKRFYILRLSALVSPPVRPQSEATPASRNLAALRFGSCGGRCCIKAGHKGAIAW